MCKLHGISEKDADQYCVQVDTTKQYLIPDYNEGGEAEVKVCGVVGVDG